MKGSHEMKLRRTVDMLLAAQRDGDRLLMRMHLQVLLQQLWQRRQQRTQEAILRLIERRSAAYERGCRVVIGLAFVAAVVWRCL